MFDGIHVHYAIVIFELGLASRATLGGPSSKRIQIDR